MPNAVLTYSTIAKEALMLLENNLVMARIINRGYEAELDRRVNGYKLGDTIPIRKPARYTIRSGATASPQDSIEKTVNIVVNTQEGVDLQFTSKDLTLQITEFSDRFLKSAMIQLANSVDQKLTALYKDVWNWVGTPATVMNTFAAVGRAGQRLDEMSVPVGERYGVLSPADNWGMVGNMTSLYVQDVARTALERAKLPPIGGIDLYGVQNVQTHTVGPLGGSPVTDVGGGALSTTYDGTNQMNLPTKGWTAAAASRLKQGDVFTINGVFAINPVSKTQWPYLQQFVVKSDFSSDGAGKGLVAISPAIIPTGAFRTVSAAPADGATITLVGSANTGYNANIIFHKNAFALVMAPMEEPTGAVNVTRETYNGLSVRMIPYYDGTNDIDNTRLDILYGVKSIYPDLATRVNG